MSTPLGSSQFFLPSGIETGQSLRFNDDDSAYLSRTPASASNQKTWTFSCWAKRGNLQSANSHNLFMARTGGGADYWYVDFGNDNIRSYGSAGGGAGIVSTAVYRDVSAWYHIVVAVDTTLATATDRVKLYVNNERVTDSTYVAPTQNIDTAVNSTVDHQISYNNAIQYYDGYLANVCLIDGQALDPTSFGEYRTGTTLWKPKDVSGLTFGTNGFFLNFSDSADIGADTSGNGNDWTPSSLAATDVVLDGPYTGGNFCVVNPLTKSSGGALQEGNLKIPFGGTYPSTVMGSMGVSSGKWYWEILFTGGAISNGHSAGIATPEMANRNIDPYGTTSPYNHYYDSRGYFYNSGTNTSASTFAPNDIIGFALDVDNDEISYYKNGTLVGSAQSIETGQTWMPFHKNSSFTALTQSVNFGADGSFMGQKTSSGYQDDNGLGDFYYAPPSGYLALTTGNLPTPAITAPDEYFNTVIYSGTGASQSITGINFQPDWIWWKGRNQSSSHLLMNAVVGNTKYLYSNSTAAEQTDGTNVLTSFDSDGFTLPADTGGYANYSGRTYVAWNWLAGNGTVSNTDGNVTVTLSANPTAGFSIGTYTGTGSSLTLGHGLSQAPEMYIIKQRSGGNDWVVYHKSRTSTQYYMKLNATNGWINYGATLLGDPTSTTIPLTYAPSGYTTDSGATYVFYAFHSVEGYSKIGSYTGNGSTNGPMVFTGFRPAFVMIKRTDTSGYDWQMWDNKRSPENVVDELLRANSSAAESTAANYDFTSNGFKLRTTGAGSNASGGTYIYIAFAEDPFKSANAR